MVQRLTCGKTGINLSELKNILKFRLRKFQDYMIKPIKNYKIKTLLLKQLCSFLLVCTMIMHLTSSMHYILDLMKYGIYEFLLCSRHCVTVGARKRHE